MPSKKELQETIRNKEYKISELNMKVQDMEHLEDEDFAGHIFTNAKAEHIFYHYIHALGASDKVIFANKCALFPIWVNGEKSFKAGGDLDFKDDTIASAVRSDMVRKGWMLTELTRKHPQNKGRVSITRMFTKKEYDYRRYMDLFTPKGSSSTHSGHVLIAALEAMRLEKGVTWREMLKESGDDFNERLRAAKRDV